MLFFDPPRVNSALGRARRYTTIPEVDDHPAHLDGARRVHWRTDCSKVPALIDRGRTTPVTVGQAAADALDGRAEFCRDCYPSPSPLDWTVARSTSAARSWLENVDEWLGYNSAFPGVKYGEMWIAALQADHSELTDDPVLTRAIATARSQVQDVLTEPDLLAEVREMAFHWLEVSVARARNYDLGPGHVSGFAQWGIDSGVADLADVNGIRSPERYPPSATLGWSWEERDAWRAAVTGRSIWLHVPTRDLSWAPAWFGDLAPNVSYAGPGAFPGWVLLRVPEIVVVGLGRGAAPSSVVTIPDDGYAVDELLDALTVTLGSGGQGSPGNATDVPSVTAVIAALRAAS